MSNAEAHYQVLLEENKRLTKQRDAYKLKAGHVEARYLPCPDHRDKHKTGDECLMCQLETQCTEGRKQELLIEAYEEACSNDINERVKECVEKYLDGHSQ